MLGSPISEAHISLSKRMIAAPDVPGRSTQSLEPEPCPKSLRTQEIPKGKCGICRRRLRRLIVLLSEVPFDEQMTRKSVGLLGPCNGFSPAERPLGCLGPGEFRVYISH